MKTPLLIDKDYVKLILPFDPIFPDLIIHSSKTPSHRLTSIFYLLNNQRNMCIIP